MRLWSIHPAYLDSKGLVALWREGLLAQKVLAGQTMGYRHHPQLIRFQESCNPLLYIGNYLLEVCREASIRGYTFQEGKILERGEAVLLEVNKGQLEYEFKLLLSKLEQRDPLRQQELAATIQIRAHPLFTIRYGGVEKWERLKKEVSNG